MKYWTPLVRYQFTPLVLFDYRQPIWSDALSAWVVTTPIDKGHGPCHLSNMGQASYRPVRTSRPCNNDEIHWKGQINYSALSRNNNWIVAQLWELVRVVYTVKRYFPYNKLHDWVFSNTCEWIICFVLVLYTSINSGVRMCQRCEENNTFHYSLEVYLFQICLLGFYLFLDGIRSHLWIVRWQFSLATLITFITLI